MAAQDPGRLLRQLFAQLPRGVWMCLQHADGFEPTLQQATDLEEADITNL